MNGWKYYGHDTTFGDNIKPEVIANIALGWCNCKNNTFYIAELINGISLSFLMWVSIVWIKVDKVLNFW